MTERCPPSISQAGSLSIIRVVNIPSAGRTADAYSRRTEGHRGWASSGTLSTHLQCLRSLVIKMGLAVLLETFERTGLSQSSSRLSQ